MSEFFYLALILIMSPTEVQVIYNKVSVAEYKAYKIGLVEKRKSFPNSKDALQLIGNASDKFAENERISSVFFNLSSKEQGGGELFKIASMGAPMFTQADVDAYAKSKNKEVTDELLVEFTQERVIKNVSRKK